MTSRARRALALPASAAALAAATLATQAFIATPAQSAAVHQPAAGPAGWRLDQTISIHDKQVILLSLDAVSAADAWAAGAVTSDEYGTVGPPLIEHWNGRAWRQVALPAKVVRHLPNLTLFGYIGASSQANVWDISIDGHYLRRADGRWSLGALPGTATGTLLIDSVKVFSPADAWAFGSLPSGSASRYMPYAARFNGRKWIRVRVPGQGRVGPVSALGPRDMWAITGGVSVVGVRPAPSRVTHWNGVSWRAVAVQPRLPRRGILVAILAESGSDVWVGGSAPGSKNGATELVRHWNGRAWKPASPPSGPNARNFVLTSLAPAGGGGIWALGSDLQGPGRLWRFSAGRWSAPMRLPWDLYQFEPVPRSRSIWALGENPAGTSGLIALHGPVPRS